MSGRRAVGLLGAAALCLAGCFQSHEVNEQGQDYRPDDALGIGDPMPNVPEAAVPAPGDAGVPEARDAAPPSTPMPGGCAAISDPVQQLLCWAAQSDARDGGSVNPQDVLDGLLGGRRDAGGQASLDDLLDDLVGGTQRDAGTSGVGGLSGRLDCRNPTDQFTRLLCGLSAGTRDGGRVDLAEALRDALSEAECGGAAQGITLLFCFLRELTEGVARRDGGFGPPRDPPGRARGREDRDGRTDPAAEAPAL